MFPCETSVHTLDRFFDVKQSQMHLHERIQGFEEKPLVTIEVAIAPLIGIVENIQKMVDIVKECITTVEDNLTRDEAVSIGLYTLEWSAGPTFYGIFNQTLRCGTKENIEPWFLYLKLFTVGLSKLPSEINQTVYRGIKGDLTKEYVEGNKDICWPFSSCSLSMRVIEQFLGQSGHRTLSTIQCSSGENIKKYSIYQTEDEVLLPVGICFTVVACITYNNGLRIIQLREIQRPESLSDFKQSLITRLENYSKCYEVDLRKLELTDKDMEFIVDKTIISNQYTEIHLEQNMIGSLGILIITSALQKNTRLQKLWLDENHVYDSGIEPLAKFLSSYCSNLKMLGLNGNEITDEGVKNLAEALKTNTSLVILRLSKNSITDQGIKFLTDVLMHHNDVLESIDISSNKFVTDQSISNLVHMINRHQSLSVLDVSDCSLSEEGQQLLRSLTQSKYGFKLII